MDTMKIMGLKNLNNILKPSTTSAEHVHSSEWKWEVPRTGKDIV